MKRSKTLTTLAAIAFLCMAGCEGTRGTISADAVDAPMRGVLSRHDAYVSNDASLSDVEKSTFLRSSAIVTDILNAAAGGE